jgi:hypothetical protein
MKSDNSTVVVLQIATIAALAFLVIEMQTIYNTVQQFQPLINQLKASGVLGIQNVR